MTVRQTHSTERCVIESETEALGLKPDCDAMTTRLGGVLLGIQTADCLPVLIGDPKTGATAAIHAGWRGTAGRITERTVADLMLLHGVNSRDCIAALGPAACAGCYEVGEDDENHFLFLASEWLPSGDAADKAVSNATATAALRVLDMRISSSRRGIRAAFRD